MRPVRWLISLSLAAAGLASLSSGQVRPTRQAVLFEGARLIAGDGLAPIENSAFLIENSRITKVGRKGEIALPSGVTRVVLSKPSWNQKGSLTRDQREATRVLDPDRRGTTTIRVTSPRW